MTIKKHQTTAWEIKLISKRKVKGNLHVIILYKNDKTQSKRENLENRQGKMIIFKGYTADWQLILKINKKVSKKNSVQFISVKSLSRVWLFATPWISASQAPLSITHSRSLFKLMSIELVMPSSHLILCHPLLLLPSFPPSIRVFSNESTLCMRWPRY